MEPLTLLCIYISTIYIGSYCISQYAENQSEIIYKKYFAKLDYKKKDQREIKIKINII